MEPFFFGPPERRLFGVYHAPAPTAMKDCGVVFCYPLAHEYYNARLYTVQVAASLCRAGLPVLRFDYYGTGESAGDFQEASVAQWLDDIGLACDELRSRGCRRLCLAGLRFGATLAGLFCTNPNAADALVLWEPIAKGADYLREIAGLHREVLAGVPLQDACEEHELLSFEFSKHLRGEIAAIDLQMNRLNLSRDVLLIESADGNLQAALEKAAGRVDYESTPLSPFWQGKHGIAMPAQAPQLMTNWILRACC